MTPDVTEALGDNQLEKMLVLDDTLIAVGIPYAYGGALALDYYTEPRATSDFDVNVFCSEDESGPVLDRLRAIGVEVTETAIELARQDGQVRLPWGAYKVDLFFSNLPLHAAMAEARRSVPFLNRTIPILAPEHLVACKAIFNRPKDWVDIANVRRDVSNFDVAEARRWTVGMVEGDVLEHFDREMAAGTDGSEDTQ